jgi:hypothetical protein
MIFLNFQGGPKTPGYLRVSVGFLSARAVKHNSHQNLRRDPPAALDSLYQTENYKSPPDPGGNALWPIGLFRPCEGKILRGKWSISATLAARPLRAQLNTDPG